MTSYKRGIEVIGGAYILNDKNQVLLFQSPKWGHKWTIPGGHIEPGETIAQAIIREIKEETNLDVDISDIFSLEEKLVCPPDFKRSAHFIFLDCIAHIKNGDLKDLKLDERELTSAKWFDMNEALCLKDITSSCKKGIAKLKKQLLKQD